MRLYLSSFRNGNKPEELLKLLGAGRKTALIHNALDMAESDVRPVKYEEEADRLRSIGLEPEELDLRDYFGKPDELKERLSQYGLIWARGGNAFILRRAYRQSGLDKLLPEMLQNDAIVYAGYSAGVDMLTPDLHGTELVDDPNIVPEGYDQEFIWDSLNILPYAFAPHYKSDHPESASVDQLVVYLIDHHTPFIALRDGEAIVIDGDKQQIVG